MEKKREERVTVCIPLDLRNRAHEYGINISAVARDAVTQALEKQTGANLPGPTPATTTRKGRAQNV